MNKLLILLTLISSCHIVSAQIENKTYTLSKYFIVANNDSLIYYSRDSLENIWDFKHISFHFNSDNTYSGNSINNINKNGTWVIAGNKFITDKDTSDIITLDSYVILLKNSISITYEGNLYEGLLISELTNYVYSIESGNWNDASTWSCNCIPQETDNVLIKINTKVLLSNSMGIQKCKHLTVEPGAVFENTGNFFQSKP